MFQGSQLPPPKCACSVPGTVLNVMYALPDSILTTSK